MRTYPSISIVHFHVSWGTYRCKFGLPDSVYSAVDQLAGSVVG